jgi:hypothetical protein
MPKNGKQVFEQYPTTDSGYADFLRNVKRWQSAAAALFFAYRGIY